MNNKETEEQSPENNQQAATFGIVFELEKTGFNGTHILFRAAKDVLKKKAIELTPILFSRYCLNQPLDQGLTKLLTELKKKKLSVDKLVSEIREQFVESLSGKQVVPNRALHALLDEGRRKHISVGTISTLSADRAQEVMNKLNISELASLQTIDDPAQPSPSSDSWLKLCKTIQLPARSCVALVTDSLACHSALTTGMYCIAIPNEFTTFHEFTGANLVVDSLKEIKVASLLSMLNSCTFRQSQP